jgi:uncharacterized protein YkwD
MRTALRCASALLAVALLLSLAPAPASASRTTDMLERINRKREARGLRELRLGRRLTRKARSHTRRMIRTNALFHSRIGSRTSRGSSWGENVGCAGSPRRLFRSLMRSRPHRENILRRGFHRAGIGVLEARKRNICGRRSVWTTQVFLS